MPHNEDLDFYLAIIPKHGVNVPPLAMSYLSAAVTAAGFRCQAKDFNLDLWKKTIQDYDYIWKETDTTLFKDPEFSGFLDQFYRAEIVAWAEEILSLRPKLIGISCFSYRSLPTMEVLTRTLKSINPSCRIVLGGAPIATYAERYIDQGFADYCIQSEGEVALVELLKGNTLYPGIVSKLKRHNPPQQIENLDRLALPIYNGVNFEDYVPGDPGGLKTKTQQRGKNRRQAGIMASRGCVRGCTFCDVASYWPKFRYRSAESVFSEMKHLAETHEVNEFYFHDSLVNGNLKELEKLLDLLIAFKSQAQFKLKGLAIVRNQPTTIYAKLYEAGFTQLQIGVESFSEKVRHDMRKKFSNDLLSENLRQYNACGISVVLLAMAGYPSETEKEFQENIEWLENHRHFIQKPVTRIDWGGTTLILPGAPLFTENLYDLYKDDEGNWVTFTGGEANTLAVRKWRHQQLEMHCARLGWNAGSSYALQEFIVGDNEKVVLQERPQDQLKTLTLQETGWVKDQERKTVGFQS